MKRFIAIFMTLCLVLGMSSVGAFAAGEQNIWKTEATVNGAARLYAAVAAIGDEIYIIGGTTLNINKGINIDTKDVDIYNTKTKQWRKGAPIPSSVVYASSCAVNDKIYVIGGNRQKLVQIYDTKTDTWTNGTPTSGEKNGAAAVEVKGKIYVISGRIYDLLDNVDIYDIATDKWVSAAPIPRPMMGGTATAIGNRIYVIGGAVDSTNDTTKNEVQIYNIETNKWVKGKSMSTYRGFCMSSVIGSNIYVMGGACHGQNRGLQTVEIYNTTTDTWSSGPSLIAKRYGVASVVIGDKIYLAAGDSGDEKNGGYNSYSIESLQVNSQTSTKILSVLLNTGENVQLSTSYNLDNNKDFTWTSTNEAVATVDANGKVTAVAEGTADIYAQNADGSFKEYIPVKVVKGIADELRLAVNLKVDEKAKLYLTDDPSQVTWSSMDESIATVSADGQVTGVKKGLAIVKAELDGQIYQIYIRVNG